MKIENIGTKEIRLLVASSLSDSQFQGMCQDDFPQVYDSFTVGQARDERIRFLVDFVGRQKEIPKLLAAIKLLNPNAYAEFILRFEEPGTEGKKAETKPQAADPRISVVSSHCDILVLAANPQGTDALQLEKEVELIKARLNESDGGREFVIRVEPSARAEDLSRYLLDYKPLIVHFAGHGSSSGDIIFENEQNQVQPVSATALANLFSVVKGQTECVVLNACFSFEKADELKEQVRCVIGMGKDIDNESALRFTGGFYRGLGFGQGYDSAFHLGRNEISLLNLPDTDVPRFVSLDTAIQEVQAIKPRVKRSFTPNLSVANEAILYPLWYGTNRKPNDAADLAKGFSGERDQQIHYGTCQVSVPKSHKIGSIGSSWWERLKTRTDDRLKLDPSSLRALNGEDCWVDIRHALQEHAAGERMGLVFIHGFNVSFEAAALRAAQIGFDLQVPGITAFYSWPSKGKLMGYPADEASIQASERFITQFLVDFVTNSGAEQVHLMAHSMGNRGLLRSIQRIAQQVQSQSNIHFGQIFLAAPDEDPDVFQDLAVEYQKVATRTTLYISSKDKALASSGLIHNEPRAGFSPPITIVPGVDTVEVSNIDLTLLGHGYYGDARPVLQDMHDLLVQNTAPEQRFGLRKVALEQQKFYWMISG
jgi:esterase/lipase superfamily enzyme